MSDQQHQQKIQQRMASMLGAANAALESWRTVSTQANVASTLPGKDKSLLSSGGGALAGGSLADVSNNTQPVLIKAGDVLFAVLDTSVNTDEPGPILATIVSGKYKGSKLIGSFTLPSKADKMVITFNTMSVPGAPRTTAITAYAIDPNTARTALASKANHHYLLRYGSLFASSFMQGIGNAFQSANTTVSIGGTGGITDTTVSNGIGRSVLENAVIGLATVGKDWGAVAKEQFQTPITVLLNAGTGVGILFTQDLTGQDLA
jgi:intracellular multiplication protein IcmE